MTLPLHMLLPDTNGLAMVPPLLSPVMILVLCVIAGVATTFMLPGGREASVRKVAGVVLAAAGLIFIALLPSVIAGGGSTAGAIYFWIFAAIALGSAVRVITHPRPVYSALYFVLTVFASAGLFVLLEAEFMAAALVLIYAGAILVTYVFVIMLASQTSDGSDTPPTEVAAAYDTHSREPAVAAAIGFALMGVLLFVIFDKAGNLPGPPAVAAAVVATPGTTTQNGPTQELGLFLFRNQLVQLELGGVLLLVSMVGAIIISHRRVVSVALPGERPVVKPEVVNSPATPVDDNPHSIPVYGTRNPRQKAFPQN